MIAETAELAVLLKLGTQGSFKGATSEIKGVEAAALSAQGTGVGGLQRGFSTASVAAGRFGGALGHAKSQIGGLISGPLGLIGLGAGLFTIGGALEHGVTKAQDFGAEVYKLKAITGLSAETVSALAAGLEHFGIGSDAALRSIGFLEKNVGLLAARKDGIVGFEKEFGLALTDTNGKIKNANDLILTTADYFNNKSIPATEKAAALAKLYGRSWQQLLPALIAGRKGIIDAEQAAKDLGLTLTEDNLGALAKFRSATRELGTAVGGLELQIGLALVPAMTDLANVASKFVAQNRDKIVGFFKDAAHFAQDLGSVVEHQVIPAFKVIAGAWGAVPKEVRDLVVAGFVGNKIIKWTFGFSPISFVEGALAKGLGGLIGKNIVQPVFVTNQLPGGGGGVPGGGGGVGTLGKVFLAAESIAALGAVIAVQQGQSSQNSGIATGISSSVASQITGGASLADLRKSLGAVDQGIVDIANTPLNVLVSGDALNQLKAQHAALVAAIAIAKRGYPLMTGIEHNTGKAIDDLSVIKGRSAAQIKAIQAAANSARTHAIAQTSKLQQIKDVSNSIVRATHDGTTSIKAKIDAAKEAQVAAANRINAAAHSTTQAIKDKDLSITTYLTANFTLRDILTVQTRAKSFGRQQ